MKKELLDIRSKIMTDSLGCTLQHLLRLAAGYHLNAALQELENISSTYRYLKQYLLTGYNDNKRNSLYRELKQDAYEISSKMLETCIAETNRSFAQAKDEAGKSGISYEEIEKNINRYAEELAVAKTEADAAGRCQYINVNFYSYRKYVFGSIYSTTVFTQANEKTLTAFLLSPATGITDIRLIISAMMLSQQISFDIHKFRILVEVYCRHTSDEARQYALIAIVFGQPDPTEMKLYDEEINEAFKKLAGTPNIQRELIETQLQVLLCTDTKQTQKTINDEIMPVLRNSAANIDLNADKSDEQLLDELIHPDKEEKSLEEIEKSMDRMRELRDSGADIFFAGFSQTKRFSFFYTLMNWFVPFSTDHPQVSSLSTGELSPDTIVKLMDMQNFCDSDKYSFYFTFSKMVRQLPRQFTEILKKGEFAAEPGDEVTRDITYKRRLYLQDLYRFYTLYSSKADFRNPFASDETIAFFTWEPVKNLSPDNGHLLQIARQLLKRDYFSPLDKLLDGSFDELNLSYLKLKALSAYRQHNYLVAIEWFKQALAFDPDNAVMIRKMAETAFLIPDYSQAEKLYAVYIGLSGAKDDLCEDEYNFSLCCLQTKDTDKAMNTLYKLYYLHEDNVKYKQALVWGLIQNGKADEALKIVSSISDDELDGESSVRKALLLWMSHDKSQAVASMRTFARKKTVSPQKLSAMLLQQNECCNMKMNEVDLYVICDLVYDE